MKIPRILGLCAGLLLATLSSQAEETPPAASPPASESPSRPWYRSPGEYLASHSTNLVRPTDVSTKIITDAKRFDVSVGKRLPLLEWKEKSPSEGWSFGIDGAMLASLVRYNSEGRLTFATNTFDGMFGVYAGFINDDGWLAMFRAAHLSAHLVDNSPQFASALGYSQFWNEVIGGRTFPNNLGLSNWTVHVQGAVGLNNTSTPRSDQPRADLSVEGGYAFHGPDSLALIASADALRPGVQNQSMTYTFFLGTGYLSRPQTTHRPFRTGLVYFRGSEYRNQLFYQRQNWLTYELAAEF